MSNTPPDSIVKITIEQVDANTSDLFLVQEFDTIPKDMPNRSKAWESMFGKLKEKITEANES